MFRVTRQPLRPFALALALTSILAPAAVAQSFQGIGDVPGGAFSSRAYNVSSDGSTVVGVSVTASGTVAVYWRNGALTSLGDLAGGPVDSFAAGTNHDGSIIVGGGRDAVAHRPLRWDGPAYALTQLPQLGGFGGGAQASGISADGQTITAYATDNQVTSYTTISGYRIDNGVISGLQYSLGGGISDSLAYGNPSADGSVVVGRVRLSGNSYQGCYWVGTTRHLPPDLAGGADYSLIIGSSASGNVLVGMSNSAAAPIYSLGEPCRWQNNVAVGLGPVPGGTAVGNAYSCNFDGSIIVGDTAAAPGIRAFIWDASHGMRELASVLTNDYGLNLTGWTLQSAGAITPDGSTIVGTGINPAGATEGWIARIPCASMQSHCAAKTNALGCLPSISGAGMPSATASSGFVVRSINMRNNKPGLLLYSTTGPASVPFQGGTLCVAAPIRRTTPLNSGGTPTGSDCTGVYAIDFNTFARGLLGGSPHAALSVPGTTVNCQFWGRDPGFPVPNNTQLSNGLRFVICG